MNYFETTRKNSVWHSPSTMIWIKQLLQERFGHAFDLQLQLETKTLAIYLNGGTQNIRLALDGRTFTRADSDLPCTQWDAAAEGWHTRLDPVLPAPGASTLPSPLIKQTPQGWYIHYDVLGLTYWMLSRQEEVGRTDLDEHGRFPATSSHAFKHAYLERPIVDEWLHLLGQVITRTWPGLLLKQHRFSMKVSHDVDSPSRYGFTTLKGLARVMVGDVLKRGDVKSALQAPWIRKSTREVLHPNDPFNTFDWIMDVSDRNGLTSAFYFICGRTSNMDADYDPGHPAIRALMRHIHQRGHEIGLHPSYNTFQQPSLIKEETVILRRIATEEGIKQLQWGGRMHYLRWEQPTTLRAWACAGLNYESTLGYADNPGFRCGTCFEYPGFDPVDMQVLDIRIRPLIAMESSIIDQAYLGLGSGRVAFEKFSALKDAAKAVGGWFTLLWHNSRLIKLSEKNLYRKINENY